MSQLYSKILTKRIAPFRFNWVELRNTAANSLTADNKLLIGNGKKREQNEEEQ